MTRDVHAVVAYDVADDKRRKKISDLLEMVMVRVQYSVFEGVLPPAVLAKRVRMLLPYLEGEGDSLRVYRLCAGCAPKIEAYGRKVYVEPEKVRVL